MRGGPKSSRFPSRFKVNNQNLVLIRTPPKHPFSCKNSPSKWPNPQISQGSARGRLQRGHPQRLLHTDPPWKLPDWKRVQSTQEKALWAQLSWRLLAGSSPPFPRLGTPPAPAPTGDRRRGRQTAFSAGNTRAQVRIKWQPGRANRQEGRHCQAALLDEEIKLRARPAPEPENQTHLVGKAKYA